MLDLQIAMFSLLPDMVFPCVHVRERGRQREKKELSESEKEPLSLSLQGYLYCMFHLGSIVTFVPTHLNIYITIFDFHKGNVEVL